MSEYVELVEKSVSNRGNIVDVKNINTNRRPYEAYTSLFSFGKEIIPHMKEKRSIANYKAPVGIRIIWVDFDDESLENAKYNVLNFLAELSSEYGIDPETLHVYFSGNKGYHVGIPAEIVGIKGISDKELPNKLANFVKNLTSNIKCVDYKIYNPTRIFRLPYSLNVKSGLYKIRFPFKLFCKTTIEDIKSYSKECKRFEFDRPKLSINKKLRLLFLSSQEEKKKELKLSNNTVFKIPASGDRNDTLHKQAYRLFSIKGLKTDEVFDIMSMIYQLLIRSNGEGFTHREFTNLINSAYNSARLNGLKNIRMNTLENLIYKAFDSIKSADYVPTGFDVFDDDLGGGMKLQNVYSFIGKSGTKKSLLAQHIAIHNAMNYDSPIIYFNMEMSTSQIFKRAFFRILNRNVEDEIKEGVIEEEDLEEAYKDLNKVLKNNFYVVDNSNLSTKDFADVIMQVEENRKQKVKLVIVDSMNCMESKANSEVFTAFENSKELKELAKNMRVAVLMINHVTATCPEHFRDTALYARGGQKIKDNNDAHFCLSKIIDKESSKLTGEDKDYVYRKDLIYIRYHNKRESGETIDKVLRLNDSLNFEAMDSSAKSFEVYEK